MIVFPLSFYTFHSKSAIIKKMDLFRLWVTFLGVFEFLPLVQLFNGARLSEMSPVFFPDEESERFRLWYIWTLTILCVSRLLLASDPFNTGLLRLNGFIHVAEACVFLTAFKEVAVSATNQVTSGVALPPLVIGMFHSLNWFIDRKVVFKKQNKTEASVVLVVVMLNAIIFPVAALSRRRQKVKAE